MSRRLANASPRWTLLVAALVVVSLSSSLLAESPSQAVDRYARLTLGEKGSTIQAFELRVGHFTLRLTQGVVTPVLAGSEPVGFFFKGSGTWEYASETPEELPVLLNNAKEISHWKPTREKDRAVVSDGSTELLWVGAGIEQPAVAGSEAPAPAADFRKHLERFSRLQTNSLAQHLAYRSLSGSNRPFAWAQLTGGRNDALFAYDGVLGDSESLSVLKKIDLSGYKLEGEFEVLPVSQQPISHRFREPARLPVGLSRVEADIEAEGEMAKIRTRETFLAREEPLRVLWLDLRSRVWNPSQSDARNQKLTRVWGEDDANLPFDHRRGIVIVQLPTSIPPGRSITVQFESTGEVLYRPSGDNYWLLGFDNWYPNPGLESSAFTWLCQVRVKKPFVPIASGRELQRRTEGDWNVVRTEIDKPIFLPIVMAGKYTIAEETKSGRTIRIASYAFSHERAVKQMSNLADQIIHFYEPFLGPFPWNELTIIEINEYGFGVAPPGTMFITQEAFQPIRDDFTRFFSKGLNERYAHEIAHQYWGHQVKWASPLDEWLSESLAEYCAGLFMRKLRGDSTYKDMVAYWRANAKDVGTKGTIATANWLRGDRSFEHRTRLLYDKGPYLLAVLHRQLGEEKFLTALRTFQSNLKWRYGSTSLVQDLLQFIDKKSYAEFFDQNVWGTALPDAPK